MATIQNIRQRAQALAEKWQKNSITPEEVGLLIDDLAALTNDAVINGNALGIRKTYASISAMEADGTAPEDAKGNALRPGQLVAIASTDADNGKIYAFSNPGWMYVTTVDAQYVTQEQLAGVEEKVAELFGIKTGLTNNYTANRILVGLEANFDFDSATINLINRKIDVQYASQFVQIKCTISGEVKQFTHSANTGNISSTSETIELTNSDFKIKVRLEWGGIAFESNDNSIILNKDKVSIIPKEVEEIPELGTKFGISDNYDANRIILGIKTNFDFDSATLLLVNRSIDSSMASQVIKIDFKIGEEAKSFSHSENNGSISNDSYSLSLKNGELIADVLVDWSGIPIEKTGININKLKVSVIPKQIDENKKNTELLADTKLDRSEMFAEYSLNANIEPIRGCTVDDSSISLGTESNWNFFVANSEINNLSFFGGNSIPYLVFAENSKCYYILDIRSNLKGRIFRLFKNSLDGIGSVVKTIEGFNEPNFGEKSYFVKKINYRYIEVYWENKSIPEDKGLLVSLDVFSLSDILSVDTEVKLGIGTLQTSATLTDVNISRNISINNKETEKIIGYERLSNTDIDEVSKGSYYIEGNAVKNSTATVSDDFMLLSEDIKAIEFTLSSLWDANFIALCLGHGKDGDTKCFASMQLPTANRYDVLGNIKNVGTSNAQGGSAVGGGRFGEPYRHPQNYFYNVKVGDRCLVEIVNEQYVCGYVWQNNKWDRWFTIDTKGYWLNADSTYSGTPRFGWNIRIGIGICGYYSTAAQNTTFISDVKILSRKGTYLYDLHETNMQRNKLRREWVAIGNSITAIDRNNGLSYVGFANRKLCYNVDNRGRSGWLIVEMWQKRSEVGWEDAISALSDHDVVTILMGTNDWYFNQNGKDYTLGNVNPEADDAKDENTTLGALRLMIERILELKPTVRLYLFTPFYRTKGEGGLEDGQFPVVLINKEGKTIYDYAEAIYNVGKEYNLPTYNMAKDSGICQATLEAYTYDNLHLNENGGKLVGEWMAEVIRP